MHRIRYVGVIVLRDTMTAPTHASEGILNEVKCKEVISRSGESAPRRIKICKERGEGLGTRSEQKSF